MKISLSWLQDFIEFTEHDASTVEGAQQIADAISVKVAEVDGVIVQGALLDKCCVGKVLTLDKHPNADKLMLCDVQTDDGTKRIVCGGTNLREGMRVAVAHVGATVRWHGTDMMTLEPVKLRGEMSEGMICGADELDLTEQFPESEGTNIIDMGDGDEGVGEDLRTHLGLTDIVLDIDNHAITNRCDLFSHIGFARECVAMGIAKWTNKPEYKEAGFTKDPIPFKSHNDCPELVPRYSSCLMEVESIGETPEWMKRRLEATGWRSVSLPVDITNYVTMEVGMPLHSFDAGDFQGDIRIRTSQTGEKITTLDNVERELPEGAIVLSDDAGIFDLLGIMGGLRSSTKPDTKQIYLHSAQVDPASIRKAIIATGHRTDASTVYEKGVPRVTVERGFLRALELFLELVPGTKVVSEKEDWGDNGQAEPIMFTADYVNHKLGTDLPAKRMVQILGNLEFDVSEKKDEITAVPPLHRLGDVTGKHDILEEIARIHGYNEIELVLPEASIAPPVRDHRMKNLRQALKEQSYFEFLPLSLLGPELLKRCEIDPKNAVSIENPIGEELSLLQPDVLPRLLDTAETNIHQVEDTLQMFHHGTIFADGQDYTKALGIVRAHKHEGSLKQTPLLELKRDVISALGSIGYTVDVRRSSHSHPAAHPGRSADLYIGDHEVGAVFELSPVVAKRFDLPPRTAVALVDLQLLKIPVSATVAESLPAYPEVQYDETVPFDHSKELAAVLAKAQAASELLESIEVVDLYEQAGSSTYNLTVRCTYRSIEKTLKEEEAKQEHEKVMQSF